MRYKFTFKTVDPLRNVLPLNYQFELGAWFFRLLNDPEAPFYQSVVESGLIRKGEPFRHFVFSNLIIPERKVEGDRLLLGNEKISLIFSTWPDANLLIPLSKTFNDARFLLGDKISQVFFHLEEAQLIPEPVFTEKMTFRTLSPIHLSIKVPGRKNDLFLSPVEEGYVRKFFENLGLKYLLLKGHKHPHDPSAGKFKLRSDVTRKAITLQSGTSAQNKLIGFQLRFRLEADPDLIKAGYYLGFGAKNHLGFGCCENL